MNVFVLCTGRSGSATFARACGHFSNYTSGHETRARIIGAAERLAFPGNHIEVDHHLNRQLGALEERYGDSATYVHLLRDREAVARSMARLIDGPYSSPRAFAASMLMRPHLQADDVLPVCLDYVDTVTANIRAFLRHKPRVHTIHMESPGEAFDAFAAAIGAEGDLDAARRELATAHNRKRDVAYARKKSPVGKLALAVARLVP